ncbi:MAG: chloride channel protein, partial [Spartobacteria bacterium]|nr:chloride channel protein [Spartobacteria bacterium]
MNEKHNERMANPWVMCGMGLLTGLVAGLGAIAFRGLIALFHNLFFLGTWSLQYDANVHTPMSPWGWGIVLAPVVGAVLVSFLVKTWAPEAKGHGVPEVMDAIYYKKAVIRWPVAVVKSLASAISIGSGGSVGREGPIIQIGSTFGSILGSWGRLPVRQRATLIAAGAGGGIAATFNSPLGGLAFAIELILPSISSLTLAPVILSTVVATYIGRLAWGMHPSFYVPSLMGIHEVLHSPPMLLMCLPFGLLIGVAAAGFIRGLYWAEDTFDAMPGNAYTRHMLGMLFVGLEMAVLMHFLGHYYVQGVGYATIMDILTGRLAVPLVLLLLFAAKYVATCLTLGSGASGGVFSPALFMGATLGATFGGLLDLCFPSVGFSPVDFAIAGMAAMVAGTTGAVMTASVMIFEQTRDYHVILPLLITVGMAYAMRKHLCDPSIYTMKLLRRGNPVPEGLEAAIHQARRAKNVMSKSYRILRADEPVGPAQRTTVLYPPHYYLIEKDGDIIGVIPRQEMIGLPQEEQRMMGVLPMMAFGLTTPETPLPHLLRKMKNDQVDILLVSRNKTTLSQDI